MSDLNRVLGLVRDWKRYANMTPGQQAAFKARLTLFEKQDFPPEIASVLAKIREVVGYPEASPKGSVTVADLVDRFGKFDSMSSDSKRAYKASITRMLNRLTEDGDNPEGVAELQALQSRIKDHEESAVYDEILRLAELL